MGYGCRRVLFKMDRWALLAGEQFCCTSWELLPGRRHMLDREYRCSPPLLLLCTDGLAEHLGALKATPVTPSLLRSAGHCLELSLDRLFAGPQAAGVEAGAAGSSGGKGGSVLSLKGWTLDMLQVRAGLGGQSSCFLVPSIHCRLSPAWLRPGRCSACPHAQLPARAPPAHLPPRLASLPVDQAACVLAGCDFLPSLKGISFRTAAGFVARRRSLGGALKAIRQEKRFQLLATQVGG